MFAAALARVFTRLTATTALAGLMGGVPWALVTFVGWPLPRQLPTSIEQVQRLLTMPVTDEVVIGLLAVAGWILWAAFAISLTAEATARLCGVGTPQLPGLHPLQALAGWLISGVTAGILATTTFTQAGAGDLTTPPPVTVHVYTPPTGAVAAAPVPAAAPTVPGGHVTLLVGDQQHEYTVARGDTLWDIAETWLGDATRWPEIWQLNQHRTWPRVSGPVSFADPDLIYPGWALTLPDDATPPEQPGSEPEPEPEPVAPVPVPPEVDYAPPAPGDIEDPSTPQGAPSPPPDTGTPPGPPAATFDPDGVVPPPPGATPPATTTPTADPQPTAPAMVDPPDVASPPASTETDEQPEGEDRAEQPAPGDGDDGGPDGVRLPDGSWLPWTLAAAIASAMAVVWLQRRRRYRPRTLDPASDTGTGTGQRQVVEEPQVVGRIRRAVRAHTVDEDELACDNTAPDAAVDAARGAAGDAAAVEVTPTGGHDPPPATTPPPAGQEPGVGPLPVAGVGLAGPGAQAAARGALIAALSTGEPTDPDAHTEVVIPAGTLVTLLGADAATVRGWPRLHVTDDLDAALSHVEGRLLATARLLDEYEVTTLTALHQVAPGERPVPPLLLIAHTPPAGMRMRTRMALGLGQDQQVSGLLLGEWGHGTTIHVDPDGTCHPAGDHPGPPGHGPDRMPVLSTQAASTLLRTLREAHTGQAPPEPQPTSSGTDTAGGPATWPPGCGEDEKAPAAPPGAAHDQPPAGPTTIEQAAAGDGTVGATPTAVPRAVVRVLGPPQITGAEQTGRQLRTSAVELLVYLAAHRDGATSEQIEEDLWPDTRRRQAAPRLHTVASNLRLVLAASAGATTAQAEHYLGKRRGRYQLGAVEVDLWQLHDACTQAEHTTDHQQRQAVLRRACDLYAGGLAGDHDYHWINPHREQARQVALNAHRSLAGMLADNDPAEAARLLTRAVDIDPMAEHIYQQAMRACHRIGDLDAIRSLLRRLARNLDTVGGEPSQETLNLVDTLRRDLNHRDQATKGTGT